MKDTITTAPITETIKRTENTSSWEAFCKRGEFNRMFECPLILITISILGGMTAGFGAWGSTFETAIVMVAAMATLASILAVAPMKAIYIISCISLIVDLLIILF